MLGQIVKEHWDLIVIIVGGAFGFGKTFQEQRDLKQDVEALKKMDLLTKNDCTVTQGACKALQCIKHEQYKKDNNKLTRLIEHVSDKSDTHYEKMLDRLDETNRQLSQLNGRSKG